MSAHTGIQTSLSGSIYFLVLFDVCDSIDLQSVRTLIGAQKAVPGFKDVPPEHVLYQHPPVFEALDGLVLENGERLEGQIKYYDYGVLGLMFQLPFSGDWGSLVQIASRWITSGELEQRAGKIARERSAKIAAALEKPHPDWLSEDYFLIHLSDVSGRPSASEMLASHGGQIARLVRGEVAELSDGERNEILQSSISYYPDDLVVVGWNAAVVYDSPQGAETAIQLLEYANSQLLEFRYYDELLTKELAVVYRFLDHQTGIFAGWRQANAASRLQAFLLDVTELTERADNAIKFLSDMYSARLYRLAASKVGVSDYKNLVNQKLRTAEDLYRFIVDQFHQTRTFVLELMVVVILAIELIYLFRGRG